MLCCVVQQITLQMGHRKKRVISRGSALSWPNRRGHPLKSGDAAFAPLGSRTSPQVPLKPPVTPPRQERLGHLPTLACGSPVLTNLTPVSTAGLPPLACVWGPRTRFQEVPLDHEDKETVGTRPDCGARPHGPTEATALLPAATNQVRQQGGSHRPPAPPAMTYKPPCWQPSRGSGAGPSPKLAQNVAPASTPPRLNAHPKPLGGSPARGQALCVCGGGAGHTLSLRTDS